MLSFIAGPVALVAGLKMKLKVFDPSGPISGLRATSLADLIVMRILCMLSALIVGAATSAWASGGCCLQASADLESKELAAFQSALKCIVTQKCDDLLPRVADRFLSGDGPAPFWPANALALSGHKEYGPLLIRAYFDASRSKSKFPDRPLSLRSAVLLACSDLPRGADFHHPEQYIASAPKLDKECLELYRRLLDSHFGDYRVGYFAMELIGETSSEDALDIVARCLKECDTNARSNAVIAIEHMPLEAALGILSEAVKDSEETVRYQAVRVLCGFEDPRVEVIFRERLKKESASELVRMMKAYLGKG